MSIGHSSTFYKDSTRAEGVYPSWISYPPDTPGIKDNILHIEQVAGDGTVYVFECARSEAV